MVPRLIDFVTFISGREDLFSVSREPVKPEDTISGWLQLTNKTKEVYCIARMYFSKIHSCRNIDYFLNYTTSALIKIELHLEGNKTRELWV